MSVFVSDILLEKLPGTPIATFNGKDCYVVVMSRAPELDPDFNDFSDFYWLSDLLASPGWREASSVNYARQPLPTPSKLIATATYFALDDPVPFPTNMGDTRAEALVFCVPESVVRAGGSSDLVVLFGTDSLFDRTKQLIRGGDLLSAQNDVELGAQWLLKWTTTAGAVTSVSDGPIVIMRTAPPFEVSYSQHVWLLPQRVNYVANPSFEGGVTHWETNGVLARVRSEDLDNPAVHPSAWVGHATKTYVPSPVPVLDPNARLYLRSASFYPNFSAPYLTFQMQAMGTGILRVGVVVYRKDLSTTVVWGTQPSLVPEEWDLTDTYTHVQGVRSVADIYEAQLLLEVRGFNTVVDNAGSFVPPELYLDQVLVEEGTLTDWSYFDGDSTYGAPDDYTWYGNATLAAKQGRSYSLWYNNKNAVAGRLFGRFVDDDALYTSTDEQQDSLTSQWVPAGTLVVPHWDVLMSNDLGEMPLDRSAIPLAADTWADQRLPFAIAGVGETTITQPLSTAVIYVTGEGAYPVLRAHIWRTSNAGVQNRLAATVTRTSYLDTDNSPAARAWRESLYDPLVTQELLVGWPSTSGSSIVLYLERGDPDSPQSFITLDNIDFRLAKGVVQGFNATFRVT